MLRLGPLLRHVGPTHATVWVETDAPGTVTVAGCSAPTFTVAGHHYALVVVHGLQPGKSTPYDVRIDGAPVWPPPGDPFPAPTIRTPDASAEVRIAFGSCRWASPPALGASGTAGVCALDALARDLVATPRREWPDLLLLLGDQVYADETTPGTKERIRARRGRSEPRHQVRDYEEYSWLYAESWTDPEVRWLFSTVPTAMIFDDHDVHDDWNTSRSWRRDMQQVPWWPGRIRAGLASYYVYQHLGNLSPDELDAEPAYQQLLALGPGEDGEPLVGALAEAADREDDAEKGYRFSYARDVGRTRVVVVDSRNGRILDGPDPADRAMIGRSEFAWLARQLDGDVDHLLVATSLPWLLAPSLHDLEATSERLAASSRRPVAALGELARRGADLEHWAAFSTSFAQLADLLRAAASPRDTGEAPALVAVLSGDVHHSYVAATRPASPDDARLVQITCSPLHNRVPGPMRVAFGAAWTPRARRWARRLAARAGVPAPGITWERTAGPFFGNALGRLTLHGRSAHLELCTTEEAAPSGGNGLRILHETDLIDPLPVITQFRAMLDG